MQVIRIIKWPIRTLVSFIKNNPRLKSWLKGLTIKYPKITAGMLKIYRRNVTIPKLEDNVERITIEELCNLTYETETIYNRMKGVL